MSPGQRAACGRLVALCLSLFLCAGPGLARAEAAAPADPALLERQFDAARALEREGQLDAARTAFRQIVENDAQGRFVPEALLALARLAWPVDEPAQLGQKAPDPKALAEAKDELETVTKKFASAPVAGEATWRLALLHLEPASSAWDPERALGLLTTLPTLYPDSPRAGAALVAAAQLQQDAGRAARARGLAFRLLAEHPTEAIAARGWIALARAEVAEGRVPDALASLGRARAAAQGRDEAALREALELSTTLDRIAFSANRGARPFELAGGPGIVAPPKVRHLVFDAAGRLLALSVSEKTLLTVNANGTSELAAAPVTEALAIDRWGRTWTAASRTVQAPAGAGTLPSLPEKTEITALAPAGPRSVWVLDGRGRRVLRLEPGAGLPVAARLPERTGPLAIASDGGAGVWVLDGKAEALVNYGEDGAPLRTIALKDTVKEAVDFDRDGFGNLYVLDGDAPAVVVFSREGQVVVRQPLLTEGEQGFGRPAALAVDHFGSVAVYDAKKKRIQWLR